MSADCLDENCSDEEHVIQEKLTPSYYPSFHKHTLVPLLALDDAPLALI